MMKKNELQHHGVKGQKWGVRRYQNADGSLTSAGRKRLAKKSQKQLHKLQNERTLIERDISDTRRAALKLLDSTIKLENANNKHRDRMKEVNKLLDRNIKIENAINKHRDKMNEVNKQINDIVTDLDRNGYRVSYTGSQVNIYKGGRLLINEGDKYAVVTEK